jgi:hypothetical protein
MQESFCRQVPDTSLTFPDQEWNSNSVRNPKLLVWWNTWAPYTSKIFPVLPVHVPFGMKFMYLLWVSESDKTTIHIGWQEK